MPFYVYEILNYQLDLLQKSEDELIDKLEGSSQNLLNLSLDIKKSP